MRVFYFLIFLTITISSFGQQKSDLIIKEKDRIDSIIENINSNQNKYSEGIVEGFLKAADSIENGGWEIYYLFKEGNSKTPIRIIYNEALEETYKNFEFFYNDEELIFGSLKIAFYEKDQNSESIQKDFYFKNSKMIYESNEELSKYDSEYIKRTEEFAFNMIQE
ncbi:hypothetical protein GCM10023115_24760 [Pontixanthobacter gangjinensis]|uniref:Uncharacterized protein n=1 Tax=Christiangramia aestuarii TaxID=1028746 RepID=A0A7K1LTG7_9FLAO|nr:hypothetical protein [Christiangramia aestuarii]MUP43891.1 hypothetical protein [Christiangramia aestuarii]